MTICPVASITLERGFSRDVAVDGGDPAARDRDVEPPLAPAAGVDDLAAADHQVEPHRSTASSAARIQVERLEPQEAVVVDPRPRHPSSRASATFAARFSGDSQSGEVGRTTTESGASPSAPR